jgi:ABC-type dipeptide/oligopeptide/nickel transport system ATPase component
MKTATQLYKKLDLAGLIVLIGQTGSGKSQIIFSYFDHLTNKYSTKDFKIIAYDVVRTDYWKNEPVMPWVSLVPSTNNDYKKEILSNLKFVRDRQVGKLSTEQRVLIHINECDLFQTEFRDSVIELCIFIAKWGKNINVQLIFETSRPTEPSLPFAIVKESNAKILCPVSNSLHAQYFMNISENLPQKHGQMILKFSDGKNEYLDLFLPR